LFFWRQAPYAHSTIAPPWEHLQQNVTIKSTAYCRPLHEYPTSWHVLVLLYKFPSYTHESSLGFIHAQHW